jgi:hypothetical protein
MVQSHNVDACDHPAPSLRDSGWIIGCANPALKRGANKRCAYGAERLAPVGAEDAGTGSFEGPPTLKPPALPEDAYSTKREIVPVAVVEPDLPVTVMA